MAISYCSDPLMTARARMTHTQANSAHDGLKACSICGVRLPTSEFTYRNRENRSYCRKCDKQE